MELEIDSRNSWDQKFFESLVSFRNSLYEGRNVLKEDISQFSDLFSPDKQFAKNNVWRAWRVKRANKVVGRLIASYASGSFMSFGFFESIDDDGVAQLLFEHLLVFCEVQKLNSKNLVALKGPIQGNFFNSYRIKLPDGGRPFFGEPCQPTYYHRLLNDNGFALAEKWSTVEVNREESIKQFEEFGARMEKKWEADGVRIRELDTSNWREELRRVYQLFDQTYSKMPNYQPIAFEDFQSLYNDFRYLINPKLVLFAEKDGVPVGFMIGMFDPLPLLLKFQEQKGPAIWKKLLRLKLVYDLKSNQKDPVILYTGKIEGTAARWSVMALGRRLMQNLIELDAKTCRICYLAEGSPTFLSLPKSAKVVSKYGLYEKPLN